MHARNVSFAVGLLVGCITAKGALDSVAISLIVDMSVTLHKFC